MNKKRNTGLDLLRIVSMFMIVMLHVVGEGGALSGTALFSSNWIFSWLFEAISVCAVNCYILISGYFLISSKELNRHKILRLALEVWGYSVVITIVSLICGLEGNWLSIINSFLPFYSKGYWFINSYIVLYLLHPYINRLLVRLDRDTYRKLVLTLVIIFSLLPMFTPFDAWCMDENNGYGVIWFVCLYIFAGYIRRFANEPPFRRTGKKKPFITSDLCSIINLDWWKALLGFAGCAIAILFFKIGGSLLLKMLEKGPSGADFWFRYNNLPVFLCSLFLFAVFRRIRIEKCAGVISFLAGGTFGVYLIHQQPLLRDYLWTQIIPISHWFESPALPVIMLGFGLLVFAVSLAVSSCVSAGLNRLKKPQNEESNN